MVVKKKEDIKETVPTKVNTKEVDAISDIVKKRASIIKLLESSQAGYHRLCDEDLKMILEFAKSLV